MRSKVRYLDGAGGGGGWALLRYKPGLMTCDNHKSERGTAGRGLGRLMSERNGGFTFLQHGQQKEQKLYQ